MPKIFWAATMSVVALPVARPGTLLPCPARGRRFRVGWCENGRELPKETAGRFRFYGTGPKDAERPLYLDFERIPDVEK